MGRLVKQTQTNFTSGELDPALAARKDVRFYYNGAREITNCIVAPQGGAVRRAGSNFLVKLPQQLQRFTGPRSYTAPNGGTVTNADDGDDSTEVQTTVNISTVNPYVVVQVDVGTPQPIDFIDVRALSITGAAGTFSDDFKIQYSDDAISWSDYADVPRVGAGTAEKFNFFARNSVTARYYRLARVGSTDLGSSKCYVGEFNLWQETGVISEVKQAQFEFNVDQAYMIYFTDQCATIFRSDTLVAYVRTVITHDMLPNLNWAQSADTMFIVQEDLPPQQLVRDSSAEGKWDIGAVAFKDIPQYDYDVTLLSPAFTLTPSAVEGVVDLTTGAPYWTGAQIGEVVEANGGRARILSFTSTTVVVAATIIPFWNTNVIASGQWTVTSGIEDAWSATRGWPRSVTFYEGALWFGGSKSRPHTFWRSRIGDVLSFDLGSGLDNEGLEFTLDTRQLNEIINIFAGDSMQFFTSGAEFYIQQAAGAAVTPLTAAAKQQTSHGSKPGTPVVDIEGGSIFVQRQGKAIREFLFTDLRQAYESKNISLLSSHLITGPRDMGLRKATGTDEADLLLIPNDDGTMAVCSTLRDQDITAWSKFTTPGSYKRAAACRDGCLYMTIERTINGSTHNYAELIPRFESMRRILDSNVLITAGLPAATFVGLDHLEGETLKVIADGAILQDVTVSGGQVTISRDAQTSVELGLNMLPVIETMPVEVDLPEGTSTTRKKRPVRATLDLLETGSCTVNGNEVVHRDFGVGVLDTVPPSYTGEKSIAGLRGNNRDATVTISQTEPTKFTLLGIGLEVSV